ncbi:MAG: curlin [Rhizobiaceae bacterium]
MKTRIARTLAAAAIALGVAAPLAGPAFAGGSFTIQVFTNDPREAAALRGSLAAIAAGKGVRGSGIYQRGTGNAAGLMQNGQGNYGLVMQEGQGHTGTVSQNGNGNIHGLFQFGRNTTSHVAQTGHGKAGATIQFGW